TSTSHASSPACQPSPRIRASLLLLLLLLLLHSIISTLSRRGWRWGLIRRLREHAIALSIPEALARGRARRRWWRHVRTRVIRLRLVESSHCVHLSRVHSWRAGVVARVVLLRAWWWHAR